MKKFILFFLLLASAALVHAQKVYFVYIQTESPTPFFVKTGDKIISSTSQGYIIIPSLHDSTYTLSIGMPAVAEKKFRVTINHNDRGFLLKDFNGNWSLFDLQSMEMINAEPEQKLPEPLAIRSDEFSRKLALAVDDPSLLFVYAKVETAPVLVKKEEPADPVKTSGEEVVQVNTVTKPAEKADDSIVQAVAVKNATDLLITDTLSVSDSVATVDTRSIGVLVADSTVAADPKAVSIVSSDTVAVEDVTISKEIARDTAATVTEATFQRSKVSRRSESSTTEGFGLVFLDEQDGVVDTIRILIPNPPVIYKTEADIRSESELASGTKVPEKEVRTLPAVRDTVVITPVNPACLELATEADFKKLRKDMVSKDNDEDMVDRSRKVFRTKCFTTSQVRLLGALFLTPGGRYSFFDAAYGHVSDPSEFGSLRSELSNDEYYLKRFKALIGE